MPRMRGTSCGSHGDGLVRDRCASRGDAAGSRPAQVSAAEQAIGEAGSGELLTSSCGTNSPRRQRASCSSTRSRTAATATARRRQTSSSPPRWPRSECCCEIRRTRAPATMAGARNWPRTGRGATRRAIARSSFHFIQQAKAINEATHRGDAGFDRQWRRADYSCRSGGDERRSRRRALLRWPLVKRCW